MQAQQVKSYQQFTSCRMIDTVKYWNRHSDDKTLKLFKLLSPYLFFALFSWNFLKLGLTVAYYKHSYIQFYNREYLIYIDSKAYI